MNSVNGDEIKIERNLAPDLKDNIFVTKTGIGRNHCLMGIHQVGKSTLLSDWALEWYDKRKICIEETITSVTEKKGFFQSENLSFLFYLIFTL